MPLPTSNTEISIRSTGKSLEYAVGYVFELNAKWLCDHYLMKTTCHELSDKTLCSLL